MGEKHVSETQASSSPSTDPTCDAAERLFHTVQDAVTRYGLASLEPSVRACKALISELSPFDVAVMGQFKSGKSSLLNAILGENVLPVGAIPVTAVITRLIAGDKSSAEVHYLDGRKEPVAVEQIGEYVSESLNSDNRRGVAIVDVHTPALLPWPGLRLVDTPGLGSTFGHNTLTTKDWLPNVAAALVVVSAERPLSSEDRQLIDEVQRFAPRVWVIVSKIDLLDDTQQAEVLAFVAAQLRELLGDGLKLIPFSIRRDCERHVNSVRQQVLTPLVVDPERERRVVFRHKVQATAQSCAALLEVALRSAARVSTDRERLRNAVLDETVQESVLQDEIALAARHMRETIRPKLERQFSPLVEPLRKRLMDSLGKEMCSWTGHLEKQTRRYESWLREHLTAELVTVASSATSVAQTIVAEAETRLRRVVEAFRNRISLNLTRELNISLSPVCWELCLPRVVVPDPSFSKTFDTNWDLLWWAIPMPVFGSLVHRHFRNRIPWEAKKNVARLVSDWYAVIERGVNDLQQQAMRWSQTELVTVGQLLVQQSDDVASIESKLLSLRNGLTAVAASSDVSRLVAT